jgi:hypothetical protein
MGKGKGKGKGKAVKLKKECCDSRPRCRRCPLRAENGARAGKRKKG